MVGYFGCPGDQLRVGSKLVPQDTDVPPYFDDFDEYKQTALEFRSSLLEIVRFAALYLPAHVLAIVTRRFGAATQLCSTSSTPIQVGRVWIGWSSASVLLFFCFLGSELYVWLR